MMSLNSSGLFQVALLYFSAATNFPQSLEHENLGDV